MADKKTASIDLVRLSALVNSALIPHLRAAGITTLIPQSNNLRVKMYIPVEFDLPVKGYITSAVVDDCVMTITQEKQS